MCSSHTYGHYDKENDGAIEGGPRLPRTPRSQGGDGRSPEPRGAGASGERPLCKSKLASPSGVS